MKEYKKLFLLGVWMLGFPCQALSQISFSVGADVTVQDNVYATPENEETDVIVSALFDLAGENIGTYHLASFGYAGRTSTYLDDSYENRSMALGRGLIDLHSANQSVGWRFSNIEQDTLLDILAPETPANFSQRSIYSTGPYINFRLSDRNRLELSAEKTKTTVEDSTADVESERGSITWDYSLSSKTSIHTSASHTTVEPDLYFLDEYSVRSGTIGIRTRFTNNAYMSLSGGQSEIAEELDIAGEPDETIKTPIYNAEFVGMLGPGEFGVTLTKGLNNAGEQGAGVQQEYGIGSEDFSIEEQVSRQVHYSLPWNGERTVLTMRISDIEAVDQLVELNQTRDMLGVSLLHRLSEVSSIEFQYNQYDNQVEQEGETAESESERFGLTFRYMPGRKLNTSCSASRQVRSAALVDDIVTNSISCAMSYQLR